MWEVYASESAWAKVVRAVRCCLAIFLSYSSRNSQDNLEREPGAILTTFVGPLVPFRVARYVLRLILLLLMALLLPALVEHLLEELELGE